jgi:hypothetical protein
MEPELKVTKQGVPDLKVIAAVVPVGTEGTSRPGDPVSFPERLAVIRELMGTFDVVTRSGQDHVLRKVLRTLRTEVLSVGLNLTDGQLGVVMNALNELEHEAGRVEPRPTAFNDNACVIVDVLVRARRSAA